MIQKHDLQEVIGGGEPYALWEDIQALAEFSRHKPPQQLSALRQS